MSSTIKELTLTYDPVNETNTFTNRDVIQGRVFLEVAKEVKINSFYIKCIGDANVSWSEGDIDDGDTYSSHERYFKMKQVFIEDLSRPAKPEPNVIMTVGETYGNVYRPGRHVFPFVFLLPGGNLPPSFNGICGSIKYILQVRLKRSWKRDHTAKTEINFAPRINPNGNLTSPQSAATEKKMKLFTSGNVSLTVTIDKLGYMQGDVIRASTYVDNASSRKLKLKYRFEQKQAFYAQGFSQKSSKTIFKVVGDSIPSGSKQTVNADLMIPSNLEQSITNCGIIKLEYVFKVYLDVPFATDPVITFSVFLLPAHQGLGPCQNQAYEPNSEPQAAVGPHLSGAAVGPAQGLHPILYPSPAYPQPSSPESPPPSYADIYPTGPGFQTPP